MKDTLEKYFALIKQYPKLFTNSGEFGEVKIITDKKRILAEQKKIRARLKKEGHPPEWIDIGVLSEDQWFYVVRDMVEFPNGNVAGYIRWINRKTQAGGFSVVLVCRQNGKFLLIKKFHHEDRAWSWEFPRGFGEPDLTARQNAVKELEEETGVKKAKLTHLSTVREGRGGLSIFLAEIDKGEKITTEIGEGITKSKWVSMSAMDTLVKQGKLQDSFSLWSYSLAKNHKSK